MAKVLVTNFHPSGGGGHVPYIEALTKIGKTTNHTIAVAAPKSSRIYKYLEDAQYPFLYSCDFPAKIQKELPSIIRSISTFRKIVKIFQPDIVHTNGGADLFITLWSHWGSKKYKIVRTHHAIKHIHNDIYHRYIYNKRVISNIYVSESSRLLSSSTGLVPNDYTIIENGVDTNVYKPTSKNKQYAHQIGVSLSPETLYFGSCAGLGEYKRVDIIIRAAAMLPDNIRPFKILVLGDKESGKSLTKLAESLGVTQFKYCGFHKDVSPYISLFDVGFILSDSIETISFAAREMMSMGKPLISSSFSGLKENVVNGINGYLVEPANVEQTTKAMINFLEMETDRLKEFSEKAREYAISRFDINKQIQKHALLYNHVSDTTEKL